MSEIEPSNYQAKLEEYKKDYDSFVYQVSHDLKAPIRGINNLAEWITEDLGSEIPADVKHKLDLLRNRSQHLENMLAAILELSRISRSNLQIETIALSPFLNEIKNTFFQTNVTFSLPDNLPTIVTYSFKLKSVIHQLFDNAIRHNLGKEIHVKVTAEINDWFIRLIISDNGVGLAPDAYGKVFNIFYTGQGQNERNSVGAGLTISKKMAEFVGGNLQVAEQTGEGSTFILDWPLEIIQKS